MVGGGRNLTVFARTNEVYLLLLLLLQTKREFSGFLRFCAKTPNSFARARQFSSKCEVRRDHRDLTPIVRPRVSHFLRCRRETLPPFTFLACITSECIDTLYTLVAPNRASLDLKAHESHHSNQSHCSRSRACSTLSNFVQTHLNVLKNKSYFKTGTSRRCLNFRYKPRRSKGVGRAKSEGCFFHHFAEVDRKRCYFMFHQEGFFEGVAILILSRSLRWLFLETRRVSFLEIKRACGSCKFSLFLFFTA